jgi:Glycolipid 2-alpha-mannosyltransferase
MRRIFQKILRSRDYIPRVLVSFHFLRIPFGDVHRWTSEVTSTPCTYGKIPREHWFQPDWIDEAKAAEYRLKLVEANVCSLDLFYF